jgi:DNA-directed RNA polymerase specialized sigma24 family protein
MGLLTTRSPNVSSRAPSHRPSQPATSSVDPAIAYFTELHRHVVRLLSSRPFEADDVAQTVVVRWWEHRHMLMQRYPDPQRFARVVTRHTLISWQRSQRSQRCEGARLHTQPDGSLRPAREWVSGNRSHHSADGIDRGELFDHQAASSDSIDDIVTNRLFAQQHRHIAYRGLSFDDIELFEMVNVHEFRVSELAAIKGCARETLARRLSRIRTTIAANRAALDTAAPSTAAHDTAAHSSEPAQ